MKKMCLFVIAAIASFFGWAQTSADSVSSSPKVPKLEYMNQLYYYNESQNKAVALEKTQAAQKTKTKLAGFGGSSTDYIIDGEKSNVRFGSSDKIVFAIKMNSMMTMDVSQTNTLRKFESSNKMRKCNMQQVGAVGTNPKYHVDGIKCQMKELSEGVYLLIPEKPLTPGEYAFISMMAPGSYDDPKTPKFGAFAFGIDP